MELEAGVLVSPAAEVPVIDGDIATAIRNLASHGVGSKTIAKQLGIARNTVRRYRRAPVTAGVQVRPAARKLSDADRQTARELYTGVAAANAVVVQRLLSEHGGLVLLEGIDTSHASRIAVHPGSVVFRDALSKLRARFRLPGALTEPVTTA